MSKYASGKYAIGICDRCAWKFLHRDLQKEPGTGWMVCSQCNDREYSLVKHPQNNLKAKTEGIAIQDARPDSLDC